MEHSLGIIMYINTLNRQYSACIDFVIMNIIYIQNILVPNRICQNVSIFDPERHKTKSNCRENISHCVCHVIVRAGQNLVRTENHCKPSITRGLSIWCWPLTSARVSSHHLVISTQFSHIITLMWDEINRKSEKCWDGYIRMASAGNIDYVMIMENIWYCYG